jgi:phenylpropionate dioxygenase-like ring-hydroxylating dioxygenase large terminal subunit
LLDHHCPHRRASLFYGRNEDNGLRCLYHGWKFDVTGQCTDIPNEPDDCPLKNKVRATAYPCREANGIIWTYLGKDPLPPLPLLGWATASTENKSTLKYQRHCNWLQAMEGDFDSSHLGFLHQRQGRATKDASQPGGSDALRFLVARDQQPRLEIEETEVGVYYGAERKADSGESYWRITQFQLPFYTSVPAYDGLNRLKIWVPIDDTHTQVWEANWSPDAPLSPEQRSGRQGRLGEHGLRPDSNEWLGRGRFVASAQNDYLIDREQQRSISFSGMEASTPVEDAAMQESMGPIVDRTLEHLSASDAAIIRMRQCLLRAVQDQVAGRVPPGVQAPDTYLAHGAQFLLAPGTPWQRHYQQLMQQQYCARGTG